MKKTEEEIYYEDTTLYTKKWNEKPILRKVYKEYYNYALSNLSTENGPIIEIGSGIGMIKDVIPSCKTTDITLNSGIDYIENIYSLSAQSTNASNFILIDVLHHLEYTTFALNQLHSALKPGGRVIIIEPYISLITLPIFTFLHHEPVALLSKINKNDPESFDKFTYFAAESTATKMTRKSMRMELEKKWNIIDIKKEACFRYFGTGGFRGKQLYPTSLYSFVSIIDKSLSMFPNIFGGRVYLVLEKKAVA